MKGKNPTRQQKKIMQERRLNPDEWLVLKNPSTELHIQHRESKKIKVLSIQVIIMDKKMIIWINNYIEKLKRDGKALSLKKLELKNNK